MNAFLRQSEKLRINFLLKVGSFRNVFGLEKNNS